MDIKNSFNEISQKYDSQRRKLIPCFDDFYERGLSMINYRGEAPKVLDIGAGTGLFSSFILKKYPKANLTLIDMSEKMLSIAVERFKGEKNVKFIFDDYTAHSFDEKFDILISALSIHHLTGDEKCGLYGKCYSLLEDGGVFINADQVLSPYPFVEKTFSEIWKESVGKSGLESEEIKRAYERTLLDKPSALADQLKWLSEAGFKYTDVVYKYYHFCVLYAQK